MRDINRDMSRDMNQEAPMADAKLPAPEITPVLALVNATADEGEGLLERARAMAEPLLVGETFDGGENNWQHAQAMAKILASIGGSAALQAACYLVYACDHLSKPAEVLGKAFGTGEFNVVLQHRLLGAGVGQPDHQCNIEQR